jgi:hypothetical protein
MDIQIVNRSYLSTLEEIDKILNSLSLSDTVITSDTLLGVIDLASSLSSSRPPVSFPRIAKDEFLNSEKLTKDIVEKINSVYRIISAETELLAATTAMLTNTIDCLSAETKKLCQRSVDAIQNLLTLHKILIRSETGIKITPAMIKGDISITGNGITGKVIGGTTVDLSVSSVSTNGLIGNSFELAPETITNTMLSSETISFVDEHQASSLESNLTDKSILSMMQFESYLYNTSGQTPESLFDKSSIPKGITTRIVKLISSQQNKPSFQPVYWTKGTADGHLDATIVLLATGGNTNELTVRFADTTGKSNRNIPFPYIERISTSSDGEKWININIEKNMYVSNSDSIITMILDSTVARYIKIDLRQDSFYETKAINCGHWMNKPPLNPPSIPGKTITGYWMPSDSCPEYKLGLVNRESFFAQKSLSSSSGTIIQRYIEAIDLKRLAIAIRDISANSNTYQNSSMFSTPKLSFQEKIERIIFHADELIPSGTSVLYEISHDNEKTWTEIFPLYRSSEGPSVLVFSSGGTVNPNIISTKYVECPEKPKELFLRGTIKSKPGLTPVIKSITIEPIYYQEL